MEKWKKVSYFNKEIKWKKNDFVVNKTQIFFSPINKNCHGIPRSFVISVNKTEKRSRFKKTEVLEATATQLTEMIYLTSVNESPQRLLKLICAFISL